MRVQMCRMRRPARDQREREAARQRKYILCSPQFPGWAAGGRPGLLDLRMRVPVRRRGLVRVSLQWHPRAALLTAQSIPHNCDGLQQEERGGGGGEGLPGDELSAGSQASDGAAAIGNV